MNLASILALGEKKTVLLGLDLRKPKIFDDFELKNELGVVNYLIGQADLDTVTHKTKNPNLFVIPSGITPPNPAELLMSKRFEVLIAELK